MTSQAIEGTGMTLTMSGGWTSDITEMQLPYSVRQAIDDTHLGDTIIRWVPSQKIEHGTMAIRFWHDPARQLPITGDPEMMVITYPDGVNHLTVVGFVEKIGKESIKVGELMQTDALVRVIDYPKAAAVPNGSFPMWTGALTGKAVTDIVETATLRYLVDTTPSSPADIDPVKCTIPGPSGDIYSNGGIYIKLNKQSNSVFNKSAFTVPSGNAASSRYIKDNIGPSVVNDFTFSIVFSVGPWRVSTNQFVDISGAGFGQNGQAVILLGVTHTHYAAPRYSEDFSVKINNTRIFESKNDNSGCNYPAANVSKIAVLRRKDGVTTLKINGLTKTCSQETGTINCGAAMVFIGNIGSTYPYYGAFYVRDWAFWSSAISDSDFSTLNDQLCAEYGIT